jgi:hypothetical protein
LPLLALCGLTHRESYFDLVTVAIVGAASALVAVIPLGSPFGSFLGNSFQAKL